MSTRIAKYEVTGMSCGHCEEAIKSELAGVPHLSDVEVNASTGSLRITFDGTPEAQSDVEQLNEAVIAAVDEAGYSAKVLP